MSGKRKVQLDDGDVLEITPLGAGNEVGRSCLIMRFKGKTIMLDCGIHPGYTGLAALPFFDEIDPADVDILLVTHFHLDHAASLPYFVTKTTFRGRIFMTHPTKAIFRMLLMDYVKVSNMSVDEMLYDEADLNATMEKIETVNFHQEVDVGGVRFWCYNAGHVLGAAMFMIQIAGVKIFYTGDYSREEDRHLMSAEMPDVKPDVLIIESTYGVQNHEARVDRERRFTSFVSGVVSRGGRCLIPVFALGRAQELLLILDEFWENNQSLQSVPIYYASALAKKCMTVYQTYTNMMNERIRKQLAVTNPFHFKHISNLKSIDHFEDTGPCVVMASPGMLQSGLSRELFELWCSNRKNGVIIPGYSVEGTLAKLIMAEPSEVTSMSGAILPLNMAVDYVSFSAHADFQQTADFIKQLSPPHCILVHGETHEMARLRKALADIWGDKMELHSPRNTQTVSLPFRGEKIAKVVGALAEQFDQDDADADKDADAPDADKDDKGPAAKDATLEEKIMQGIVVRKDFRYHVVSPPDLITLTQLKTSGVRQVQAVPFHQTFPLLTHFLSQMFDDLDYSADEDGRDMIVILEAVSVTAASSDHVVISWESDPANDMIADSVLAVILQVENSPNTIKLLPRCQHNHGGGDAHDHDHDHGHDDAKKDEEEDLDVHKLITDSLREFFGVVVPVEGDPAKIVVSQETASAVVDLDTLKIESSSAEFLPLVDSLVQRVVAVVKSL